MMCTRARLATTLGDFARDSVDAFDRATDRDRRRRRPSPSLARRSRVVRARDAREPDRRARREETRPIDRDHRSRRERRETDSREKTRAVVHLFRELGLGRRSRSVSARRPVRIESNRIEPNRTTIVMSRALASRATRLARAASASSRASVEDVLARSRGRARPTRGGSNGSSLAWRAMTFARARATTTPWYAAAPGGRAVTLLYAFASASDRARWETFGDFEHGGASACALEAGRAAGRGDGVARATVDASTSTTGEDETTGVNRREALMRSYASLVGRIDCGVPASASARLRRAVRGRGRNPWKKRL